MGTASEKYPSEVVLKKFENLYGKKWHHGLGDGKASQRIAEDLLSRLDSDAFRLHKPEDYHHWIERAYREDEL